MAPARPIVLVTDFGHDAFYVGVMKAVIAAGSPSSRILDLDHEIPAHDVAAASFVLARSLEYLPPDAVVVVVVDPGVGSARRGLVVTMGERVLVGPDNGFLSDLVAGGASPDARVLDEVQAERAIGVRTRGETFHGRDLFGPVAAAIARGVAATGFGAPAGGIAMLRDVPSVSIDGARVRGRGRYADRFGNVLSDIPLSIVQQVCGDESRARVSIDGREVGPLRRTYADGGAGELIAVVNSWGLVEAAVRGGRAVDRLGAAAPGGICFEIRGG